MLNFIGAETRNSTRDTGISIPFNTIPIIAYVVSGFDFLSKFGLKTAFKVKRTFAYLPQVLEITGAPSRIRTCDLRIRSPSLYPTELWAQNKQEIFVSEID